MTDEYRAKAEYCRQMADQVLSPLDKETWLQLAWDWSTLASVREHAPGTGASVGAVDAGATLTRLFGLGFLLDAHVVA